MDNLEKNLSQLPKPALSKKADVKIRAKIYQAMFLAGSKSFVRNFLHPHSLVVKISYVSLLVFVLLGGTAVYAANNDHITPGHSLYPVKKTIENVEQQLSLTKKSQVETLNKFSERRLKEAVNLSEENLATSPEAVPQNKAVSDNIQQTITEAVSNLDQAIDTTKKIENKEKAQEVKKQLQKNNEDMVKYLDNIDNLAKERQDEAVVKKVQEARKSLDEYRKKLEQDDDAEGQDKDEDKKVYIKNREDNKDRKSNRLDHKSRERD